MLAIAVLVVLGVGYLLKDSLTSGKPEPTPVRPASFTGFKKPAPLATPRVKTPPADLDAMTGPISTTVITVPLPPFPVAAAIKPGTSKREVVRQFGPPNYTVTWSDAATLYEKYTYVDHQRATSLVIQSGKVVSSETGPAANRLSAPQITVDWD